MAFSEKKKNDRSVAYSGLFLESCPYNVDRKNTNLHGGVMLLLYKDVSHEPLKELENGLESVLVKSLQVNWQRESCDSRSKSA